MSTQTTTPVADPRRIAALVGLAVRYHRLTSVNRCTHPDCANDDTWGQHDHPFHIAGEAVIAFLSDGTELCKECGTAGAVMWDCHCCTPAPFCADCKTAHEDEIDLNTNYDLYKDPPL